MDGIGMEEARALVLRQALDAGRCVSEAIGLLEGARTVLEEACADGGAAAEAYGELGEMRRQLRGVRERLLNFDAGNLR